MRAGVNCGLGTAAMVFMTVSGDVAGAIEVLEREGFSLSLDLEAGVGGFLTKDTNFGVGRIDLHSGEVSGDAQWGEGYLKPSLSLDYDTTGAGVLYGGASAVGSLTVGDGDAGGFTDGGDKKLSLEALYGGWRSGALLAESLGEDALDLSAGRQNFQVGDGFLIWDGNFDNRGDGAYWLGPRTAFELAGLARVNTSPLGGQAFFLRADHDQGDTELAGVNLDYGLGDLALGEASTAGAMYLQITEVDSRFEAETPRDGMQLATIRVNDVRVPGSRTPACMRNMRGSSATVRTSTSTPRRSMSSRSTTSPGCRGRRRSPTVLRISQAMTIPRTTTARTSIRCSTITRAAGAPGPRARSSANTCCSTAIR
jgi:hypothetical protein